MLRRGVNHCDSPAGLSSVTSGAAQITYWTVISRDRLTRQRWRVRVPSTTGGIRSALREILEIVRRRSRHDEKVRMKTYRKVKEKEKKDRKKLERLEKAEIAGVWNISAGEEGYEKAQCRKQKK